jgi:hypothetical protein
MAAHAEMHAYRIRTLAAACRPDAPQRSYLASPAISRGEGASFFHHV